MPKKKGSYTNKASIDGTNISSQITQKVTGDNTSDNTISKNGVQQLDADGNATSKIKYTVIVNPDGADLLPDSDTITLTDKLSTIDANLQSVIFNKDDVMIYN